MRFCTIYYLMDTFIFIFYLVPNRLFCTKMMLNRLPITLLTRHTFLCCQLHDSIVKRELPIEKSLMFALIHGLILYTPCHGNTLLLLLSPTRVASFKDFEWTGRFNSPTHVTSYGTGSWDWELVSGIRFSGPRTQIDPSRIPGSMDQSPKKSKSKNYWSWRFFIRFQGFI